MSITLAYDAQLSRVRVAVSTVLPGAVSVTVQRSTDQIRWTTVRGGLDKAMAAGAATVDDYEFAPDIVNYYRATILYRVSESFEDATLDISIANSGNAAWARNNAQAHTGTWSLKSGTITDSQTSAAIVSVPAGATVLRFWYRVSSEDGFDFLEVWRDAETELIVEASGEVAWTQVIVDVTGVSTVTFEYAKDTSTSGGSDAAWVDDLTFDIPGAMETASITPMLGKTVWLKSIARPFLNLAVRVQGFSTITRPSRSGVFDIVGRSLPIEVSDVRSGRRWTLNVWMDTPSQARGLDLLLASGDTLLIQVPANAGRLSTVPSGYVSIGDTQGEVQPTHDMALSLWGLPCTEVAAPGPDVIGSTSTWQTVLNTYATWADVMAAHETWADLLELIGDPEDVIVP